MNVEEVYVENILNGEGTEEYLSFMMPIEKYLEYDDPDVYQF